MAAQIAIFSNDTKESNKLLYELSLVDESMFLNRRGTFLWKQGKIPEAYDETVKACGMPNPTLDTLVQKVDLMILLDRPEAELEIKKLEPRLLYHNDILNGLWSRYYLKKGEWKKAESYWSSVWLKSLPVFVELKRIILTQKADDTLVNPIEREKAKSELSQIETQEPIPLLTNYLDEPDSGESE